MQESLVISNYQTMVQHLEAQGFSFPGLYPKQPDSLVVTRLVSYLALLQAWTTRVDLVSPATDLQQIQRHLVDCMAAQLVLGSVFSISSENAVGSKQLNLGQGRTADIGSGAGLPGLIWAIAEPQRQFVLVEPRKKRVVFLREVASRLQLENLEIREERQEDLVKDLEKQLAVVACRALGALSEYLNNSAKLLASGGVAIVLAGPGEIEASFDSPELELLSPINYTCLPDGPARRLLVWKCN